MFHLTTKKFAIFESPNIMKYWLMKSEPCEVSILDLEQKKRVRWDGVRNYQARNYMRDDMQVGDLIIFYHSSCDEICPAVVAEVASLPYPDHTQFTKRSKYLDAKSTKENPRWILVDVRFVKKFPQIVSRAEMQKNVKLKNLMLWNRPRLSIIPLTEQEFKTIVSLVN